MCDDEDKENLYDFDSDSSDLYQPNEIANAESSSANSDYNINSGIVEYEEIVIPTETYDAADVPRPPEAVSKKRKRSKKANQALWKRKIVKNLRVSGQAYTNRSGKEISKQNPRMVDCSKCRFKCNENFPEEHVSTCVRNIGALQTTNSRKYISAH